ncbi:MAG: chromate transporter [Polyangiaceae bacterium]
MADEDLANAEPTGSAPSAKVSELALLFLRLGFTAFGGPAAHIAIMESEVVRRRRWLSSERFLDLLGVSTLIPGPSSTELAIFIGYERAGWLGLVLAGVCFILPAAIMVAFLAWAYVTYGTLPQMEGVLYGIKPVVIAVVVQALWGLAPKAIKKSVWLGVLGLLACVASALGAEALLVLLGGGVASVLANQVANRKDGVRSFSPGVLAGLAASGASVAVPVTLATLFLTFLKIGAVVFGSGYVLLAFLRADLVDRLHWLTESQLLDAVAVGQATPGPVFTTATFIGYVIGGRWGALLATVGIFLPGFVLVAVMRPLVDRVRRSPAAGAFLDGVNVAALALMAVVTVQLARTALVDLPTILIALVGAALLIRFKVNTTWLVAGGAILGAVMKAAQ